MDANLQALQIPPWLSFFQRKVKSARRLNPLRLDQKQSNEETITIFQLARSQMTAFYTKVKLVANALLLWDHGTDRLGARKLH